MCTTVENDDSSKGEGSYRGERGGFFVMRHQRREDVCYWMGDDHYAFDEGVY